MHDVGAESDDGVGGDGEGGCAEGAAAEGEGGAALGDAVVEREERVEAQGFVQDGLEEGEGFEGREG